MKFNQIEAILWDFDGVLLNSNAVRDYGFLEVLKGYPKNQVEELMSFHRMNGGLSRYVKFRYFFENIRKESITQSQVNEWAKKFSISVVNKLIDPNLLIEESIEFVRAYSDKLPMHIVSGSDGNELRYICEQLDIASYFQTINGSPTPKKDLVKNILNDFEYTSYNCLLIGDSQNDYDAAIANGLRFAGYNNLSLIELGGYLHNLNELFNDK